MNYRTFLFLLALTLYASMVFSQGTVSRPQIFNYSSGDYKGGIQNWDVAQDSKGIMYFGNNEGLLSFDGQYWRLYPLPNSTIVRSISIDQNDRIYVGGQDEIGYFEPNVRGTLIYYSLKEKLPEAERLFSDVWHIETIGEDIFFHTSRYIFRYRQDKMIIDRAKSSWQFLGEVEGKIFAHEMEMGLMQYDNGIWKPILKTADLNGDVVTDMVKFGTDTLLISTLRNGLYYLSKGVITPKVLSGAPNLKSLRISALQSLEKNRYAVGTISGGLFIMDEGGKVIQRYMYKEGLQTNHIRAVFIDKSRNLWLAMDEGIDYIAINSSIGYIQPDESNSVGAYSLRIFEGDLFVGTSNGLYTTSLSGFADRDNIGMSQARFSKVPYSNGQVWSLQEFNGHFLMAHEDGSFEVKNGAVFPISNQIGTWLYSATSRVFPSEHLIAGTYEGLHHLIFDGQRFTDLGHIKDSGESLRFIHYDDNTNAVWISHPYRGISKLGLSADFSGVSEQKRYDLPGTVSSVLHNYMFYIKNKVIVCNPQYIYEYDEKADEFIQSSNYAPLNGLPIQYMVEDKLGNVWFASNKRLGVLDFSRPTNEQPYTILYFPELNGKILGGFESVYLHDAENVFISGQKGGILLNYKAYQEQASRPNVLLRMVKAFDKDKKEQLLFGGHAIDKMPTIRLAYAFNSLQFDFSSTLYDQQDQVEFSYMLEGLENNWSAWSNKSDKEYTNLQAGTYIFKVKSRNGMGNESEVQIYTFRVNPPWYTHPISYFLYTVLIVLFIFWLLNVQRKKLKQRHQDELHLRRLEIEKKEKEVIRLRNEKLEAELGFKDKELANLTMNIIQRGEVLSKIKDSIGQTMDRFEDKEAKSNFRQLIRLIRSAERTNEDWEKFNTHIHHANENFFFRLKEKHPDLTANELKLCALLRMNLLTKEIAQLMHVSVKAVEVGRYRLRKKLKIDSEVNLYDYLLEFAKTEDSN